MNNPAAPEIKIPPSTEVEPEDMPLPTDAKTVFLGLLVVMAGLACAYFAREVILPIVLAFVLKLLLQPVMRVLGRLHIPRPVASLALILALWGILAGLGGLLSGPAHAWAARLPEGLPRLQERVKIISAPLQSLQEMTAHAKGVLGQSAGGGSGESAGKDIQGAILTGAQTFASEFLTTFLVLSSSSIQATRFCAGSWRSCPASGTSGRSLRSLPRSKAMCRRTWSPSA